MNVGVQLYNRWVLRADSETRHSILGRGQISNSLPPHQCWTI